MKTNDKSMTKRTLSLFWQFTRPNKAMFWYGTIGASIAVIATDVIPTLIIAQAFNKIEYLLRTTGQIQFNNLLGYIYVYVAIRLFGIFAWRTQAYVTWRYAILSKQRIYNHLFNHIQSMGARFHADRFGGALVSQVNKFVSGYDRFIADFTWSIITGITALIASLAVLFVTSWQFAVFMVVYMSVYFVVIYRRMKRQAPYNRDLASKESEQTAKLADAITNIATVRAFAGEKKEKELFAKQTQITTDADLALMRVQMKNELASQIGTASLNALAFIAGILAVTKFGAAVGTLVLAVSYTNSLARRLWDSMFIIRNMNRAFADAAEMTEILAIKPEIKDPKHPEKVKINKGKIQFKNVFFGYQEQDHFLPVFSDLNIHIEAGEKIGLVGHSGGGKTTITKLLLRFVDIQSGKVLIDGQDITKITQSDLRKHITYVSQEPILFHRSIEENILYGKPRATSDEVRRVAQLAHAHEFIEKLPLGYDTLVGERGVKLSGGQKQRIAIARAMLKDAPILVLDEATSALDSESEKLIQESLWALMDNKTSIVIAHRLSTIQKMDRIIVMDKGQILEQGTHKELIRQNGAYAKLWAHQSGGFIEE